MRSAKAELPAVVGDGFVFRGTTWGGMDIEFDTFDKEFDSTPLLKGLPDDMNPVHYWGYVFKGSVRVRYKGREEIVNAGDVFYTEQPFTAVFEAGTEYVIFSRAEEGKEANAVIERNIAALQQER